MKKALLILSLLPLFFCFTSAYNCSTLNSRYANVIDKNDQIEYERQILQARSDKLYTDYDVYAYKTDLERLKVENDKLMAELEVLQKEKDWCDEQDEKYRNYLKIGGAALKELQESTTYDPDLLEKGISNYKKALSVAQDSKITTANISGLKEQISNLEKLKKEQDAQLAAQKQAQKKAEEAEKKATEQTKQNTTTTTITNTKRNNRFSDEYNDAYEFAYANKITTMPTIEEANMYNPIIRAEIAKMLANWVKSLGYTPDTSAKCNFIDIGGVKGDLYTAIIESCQLGIMGQGITKFRPFDNITRGEVATAVSRILWGHQYDGGNPFYASHINALFYNGVLPNADNAELSELRGSVMVMLMNASNKVLGNSTSSNTTVDNVIDYNDKILDLINECIADEDKISALVENDGSAAEIKKATNNVINKCKNSIEQLTKLGGWEGDTSLKDGALKYVALNVVYYQQFLELVPYLDIDNLSSTQEKEYNNILEKMDETNEKLDAMNTDLENIQKKFAKKFGYQLEG